MSNRKRRNETKKKLADGPGITAADLARQKGINPNSFALDEWDMTPEELQFWYGKTQYRFRKIIDIDENRYELTVSQRYEAVFNLVRGYYRKGGAIKLYDDFFDDTSQTEIFGIKKPIKTIRRIIQEFRNYLYEQNPPMFRFGAFEDSRKKLYKRICLQLEKTTKYKTVYSEDGSYMLLQEKKG